MKKVLLLIFSWIIVLEVCAQTGQDTFTPLRKIPSLYSIVLSVGDTIRYNQHFNGTKDDDIFDDQSLTKSIGCFLIGIAIDKGLISSPDEKLVHWFPELKNDTDKRKQDITLRQVMNQASGLYHENLEKLNGIADFLALPDPAGYTLKAPLLTTPGKEFHYNNAATHLLSVILSKSCGMDVFAFAQKNLFNLLGIQTMQWKKMKDGYYDLSGLENIRLRTVDLIKFGSLLLHEGRYGQQQIVSPQWIAQILHPDIQYDTEWGFHPSRYGLCWYHTTYRGQDMIYGMGWGGQFLIVVPALKMVMAINQSHEDDKAPMQSGRFTTAIFPLFYDAVLQHWSH
ncbi:CubicO group peptidase (beta-lactamase class C family) [Chitinophaga niastensis]|uniref:CubicO group peptidase (Beta-lactamase class C family) n=1 Tax=Chitinophaga niastensis TaxID=536980 RepID=A0A2P8HVU4_CHINA|nr:serine hydrolase [Chitinophaga niastensis]PSL50340.1 CubicO group peptidase (beta-lactamase class C family) [Chitinophaga niastensis]